MAASSERHTPDTQTATTGKPDLAAQQRYAILAALLVLLCTVKVFSPQYLYWAVPLVLIGLVFSSMQTLSAADPIDFQKDIQPLLIARCYSCHDSAKQTAGYRLDLRSKAIKGGESGQVAILPGKPEESDLYTRITSTDPQEKMPPKGEPLTAEQISRVRTWILEGAKWPDALAGDEDAVLEVGAAGEGVEEERLHLRGCVVRLLEHGPGPGDHHRRHGPEGQSNDNAAERGGGHEDSLPAGRPRDSREDLQG